MLGEIVAQHLEHRLGEKVDRKLNLGGTLLAHQALAKGAIDVYPEYTGTALTDVLKLPPSRDAAAVLETRPRRVPQAMESGVAGSAGIQQHVRHGDPRRRCQGPPSLER